MKRISSILMGALLLQIGYATCAAQDTPVAKRSGYERPGLKLDIPDSNRMQILTTQDGTTMIGRIADIGTDEIRFETSFGEMAISLSEIREIRNVPASSVREGQYWFPNPNATRLFFAPTGRMLKQGEGYFADYYLFFPTVTFGLTDRITFGCGMSIIPGADQLFYFTPKVGLISTESFNVAAGALIVKVPGDADDDNASVGILYGVGTFGGPDASVTAGIGYGYSGDDLADRPVFMIGGEKRLSRRIAFVTENWIVPGTDPLVSGGFRFFGRKMSVDLGLMNMLGEDAVSPGVPYIDFVFKF